MRLRLFEALHAGTLGLMMLLAGASNCFSQSYDPDPWDNTPPVTVAFDYVLPHTVATHARADRESQTRSHVSVRASSCIKPLETSLFTVTSVLSRTDTSVVPATPLRR